MPYSPLPPTQISNFTRNILRSFGVDLIRYVPVHMGVNPYADMCLFNDSSLPITFIDAGSHLGESTVSILDRFSFPLIHCFEPCQAVYPSLKNKFIDNSSVSVWNMGLANVNANLPFNENEFPFLSSFFNLGPLGYGNITNTYNIPVMTLDTFASTNNIKKIDILKIDASGHELDILKGAQNLMSENLIKTVHVNLFFLERYLLDYSFSDIILLLGSAGFKIVGVYRQHYQDNYLSWADFLFINPSYIG